MIKRNNHQRQTGNRNEHYKDNLHSRLVFISIIFMGIFLLIIIKLIILQVIKYDYYLDRAISNIQNRHTIQAKRGTIFDRRGNIIAKDIIQYSIALSGNNLKNRSEIIKELSEITNQSSQIIQSKIKNNPNFVYIAHKIASYKIEGMKYRNDPGLILEKRFLRIYPYQENGAHVIGFCDIDNNPLAGIEYQYNNYLQGKPGWKIYQRDAFGTELPNLDFAGEEPIDGFSVHLTIDMEYQLILEDELRKSVELTKAEDGVAILMNPQNGEILALANFPQFDSNKPNMFSSVSRKNKAVSDVFEPGSTFKIAVFSTALECSKLNLYKDIFFCENGRYKLYNQTVEDHEKYAWLTPQRILEKSSNIGTMKIAQKVKKEDFYKYVRNLGFGIITGIDLPGESPGILRQLNKFAKVTHYYMSIGYGIGVTPIQLINAYAVVANGGSLYTPYIMKRVEGPYQRSIAQNSSKLIREVLSSQTTELLNSTLIGVIEEGTGIPAKIDGFTIAGKTGTAQLYNSETRRHDSNKHLASFVGYFPAQNPQYVLLVMLRNPKGQYYGGQVAAPAFQKMAHRILAISDMDNIEYTSLDRPVLINSDDKIPLVVNLDLQMARKILTDLNLDIKITGNGEYIKKQETIKHGDNVIGLHLFLGESVESKFSIMPLVTGLSLKEAISTLSDFDIAYSVEGNGVVVSQNPKAGSKINKKASVKLVCNPS